VSEKSPQTTPNYPPFGGVVWGGLGGLSKHRFGAPKSALFPGPVFDHDFGLVFEVFSKGVNWGGSPCRRTRPNTPRRTLGGINIYTLNIYNTGPPPTPPYPPYPGGPVWGHFSDSFGVRKSDPKLPPKLTPLFHTSIRPTLVCPKSVKTGGPKVGNLWPTFGDPFRTPKS
jgi:hypothetical protein